MKRSALRFHSGLSPERSRMGSESTLSQAPLFMGGESNGLTPERLLKELG